MHLKFDKTHGKYLLPAAAVLIITLLCLPLTNHRPETPSTGAAETTEAAGTTAIATAPPVPTESVPPAPTEASTAAQETTPAAPVYTLCKEPPQIRSAYHVGTVNAGFGWFQDKSSGGWRYVSEIGTSPAGEWDWIDTDGDQVAECFYFSPDGFLTAGMIIDGYTVDSRGRWVRGGKIQTLKQTSLNDCWFRWNAIDSRFGDNGWKYTDMITPENIYVGLCGERILVSDIDTERMQAESRGTMVIAVKKSTHFLEVWQNGEKIRSYVITTGGTAGDKEIRGDRKTPEGEFYVCQKNPSSGYTRGLFLNYPNAEDADRGLAAGLISQTESDAIKAACAGGGTPPYNTALGGDIEIHGARDQENNSNGCIELLNNEMIELYDMVPAGTRVIIEP